MSSPTTLDGYMRLDADNLGTRLIRWWNNVENDQTVCINIYHRPHYGGKPDRVNKEGVIWCDTPVPEAVDGFVETIEKCIIDHHGEEPWGTFRISGYQKGNASKNELDFSRTLVPSNMGDGDPNLQLVQRELDAARKRISGLEKEQTTTHVALVDAVVGLSTALKESATVRTVSSASADLSSIAAVVGLLVLIGAKPAILRFFNLPPNATAEQLGIELRKMVAGTGDSGTNGEGGPLVVPDSATTPKQITIQDLGDITGEQLLAELDRHPELLKQALQLAAKRPDLMQIAMDAQ